VEIIQEEGTIAPQEPITKQVVIEAVILQEYTEDILEHTEDFVDKKREKEEERQRENIYFTSQFQVLLFLTTHFPN
jgi:hypothetical protein